MDNANANLRIIIIDANVAIHGDFIKILTTPSEDSALHDLEKIFTAGKTRQALQLPKFQIDTASQGEEGVRRIKQALHEGRPYALAFVDIRMPPGWEGVETIKRIWALDEDIQVVICTACSDYSWEETIANLGQSNNLLILKKPFDSVAVRQLACALTCKWQLMQDAHNYTSALKQQVADRTASLQASLSLMKATLESSNNGILVINKEGSIVDYNQKLVSLWKIPRNILEEKKEIILRDFMKNQLVAPEQFLANIAFLFANDEAVRIDILKFNDGRIFECYSQPHKLENKTVGRVFDFRDITRRAQFEQTLQHQATHDALTGLPNRVMLLEQMRQAMRVAMQEKTYFALLFIDLDRFKLINDSLSHAVGDEVLQVVASRLQSVMRPEDTLARLGGDEFVIVLTHITEQSQVLAKARRVQDVFQQPFMMGKRSLAVTASMGVSVYPQDGEAPDILLRNADAAMYLAKEKRDNNFQFYTKALNTQSLARLEQETQLRAALANNEFFLCYQPQLDLKTGSIIAVEALLRWQHPQRGELLPLDFIPMAEETGLIVPIGAWVIRAACLQAKRWQMQGLPKVRVAVNVSAPQFMHDDMVAMIRDVLQETELAPRYLELELTENVIISHQEIMHAVKMIKDMGVKIAIDDFGTGYSSLSYLKKIPLDRLKIDRSFIQHIQSPYDDVIVRAVIAMAKNLDLEVLAEGVETQDQLDFLKRHACEDAQGFYFSKPVSADELAELLKTSVPVME